MTDTLPQRIEAAEGADREQRQCMNCPAPVSGHVMLCQQCFDDDQAYDDCGGCANCGGEGFTYGCSWDWQCDTYDEGEGTCLCTRRCEWCNPLTPAEIAGRNKLRDVLATALAKDKVAALRAKDQANG